jgi:hypothetical protein
MLEWFKSRVDGTGPIWIVGTGLSIFLMLAAAFTAAGATLEVIARIGALVLPFTLIGLIIWLMTIPPHKRNIW